MDPQAIAEAVYETMEPNDRVFVGLDMRKVSIAPGCAVLEMNVREDMLNGHDICHGSMVFASPTRPLRSPPTRTITTPYWPVPGST